MEIDVKPFSDKSVLRRRVSGTGVGSIYSSRGRRFSIPATAEDFRYLQYKVKEM